MTEPLKKKMTGTMGELTREHPTLQKKLESYRDRKSAYDAKRGTGTPASSPRSWAPVRPTSSRELRG